MVAYARDSGHFLGIDTTTNATMLNPKLNRDLIRAGLTRIHISVEGLSAQEYEQVSGVRIDFEAFRRNLQDLYDHKGQCHIFLKTVFGTMEPKEEQQRKERFYELFGDMCDEITIEHIAPCWPGFDKQLYHESIGVYGNQIQEIQVCPRLFYILTVNSDGAVTRCIVDWNRKMLIGNVRETPLPQLWKQMDEFRIAHLKGRRRDLEGCRECLEIETAALDNIDAYREVLLNRFLPD